MKNNAQKKRSQIVSLIVGILFIPVFGYYLYDWFANQGGLGFYILNPKALFIPSSIAAIIGIAIYFFAIHLPPQKRRLAGLIWWGIGNVCLSALLVFLISLATWIAVEYSKFSRTIHPPVAQDAIKALSIILFALICSLFGVIVSWYFLLRSVRKAAKAATGPAGTPLAEHEAVCGECGKAFAQADMVCFDGEWICGGCKPRFVQKLKEGAEDVPE